MKEQPHICPLCGQAYDEPPALSRVDNQTDICPRCGMMEALAATHAHNEKLCQGFVSISLQSF